MKHTVPEHVEAGAPIVVSFRCPHCRHQGTFHGFDKIPDATWPRREDTGRNVPFSVGIRRCPNRECGGLIFVVLKGGALLESLPPEIIDFDSTNLPPQILDSLEEAIKAHAAGCYRACALTVRRVLEELCRDKGAKGNDLRARLKALSTTIVVPNDLLDAADELRLLGNDAAHVEAKSYDSVGADEAKIAIELAKELLKAVYQYSSLVDRLKALKKPANP